MGEKIRTFIAIGLPESVLRGIGNTQDVLRKSGFAVRWVRKEGIHLTLKFLGDVDRGDVGRIRGALERAAGGFAPFTLRGKGVGVFPNPRRPRVVWAGLSGDTEVLSALHGDLEAALDDVGFPKEKRPFGGHLTLGRVKGRLDNHAFRRALDGLKDFETEPFTVKSVVLFQSTLRPQGAVYSRLAEVEFKGS